MPKGHQDSREVWCRRCGQGFVTDRCGRAAWYCPDHQGRQALASGESTSPKVETPVAISTTGTSTQEVAPARTCLWCKVRFSGLDHWCSETCRVFLEPAPELLVRIQRLASEGIDVLLDVELRRSRRFVTVTTTRGRWEVAAWKMESWEDVVSRALNL